MRLVGFEPFLRQRENLFAHDRRHRDRNPILTWSLMVSAVTRRDAAAHPYRSCNSLARRNRGLAKTSLPLVSRIAQHAPNHRAFPTPTSLGCGFIRKTDQSTAYYQIDDEQAQIVQRDLYCVEGLSIGAIARRLNEQDIPDIRKGRRSALLLRV